MKLPRVFAFHDRVYYMLFRASIRKLRGECAFSLLEDAAWGVFAFGSEGKC